MLGSGRPFSAWTGLAVRELSHFSQWPARPCIIVDFLFNLNIQQDLGEAVSRIQHRRAMNPISKRRSIVQLPVLWFVLQHPMPLLACETHYL